MVKHDELKSFRKGTDNGNGPIITDSFFFAFGNNQNIDCFLQCSKKCLRGETKIENILQQREEHLGSSPHKKAKCGDNNNGDEVDSYLCLQFWYPKDQHHSRKFCCYLQMFSGSIKFVLKIYISLKSLLIISTIFQNIFQLVTLERILSPNFSNSFLLRL